MTTDLAYYGAELITAVKNSSPTHLRKLDALASMLLLLKPRTERAHVATDSLVEEIMLEPIKLEHKRMKLLKVSSMSS